MKRCKRLKTENRNLRKTVQALEEVVVRKRRTVKSLQEEVNRLKTPPHPLPVNEEQTCIWLN
jgi:hypothetical protein